MKITKQKLITLKAMPTGGASDRTLKKGVKRFTIPNTHMAILQAMPTGGGSDKTLKKNVCPFSQVGVAGIKQEVHMFPFLVNMVKQQHAATRKNKNLLTAIGADVHKLTSYLADLQKTD